MDVRKYEALTMQDAVKLIKKELGRDAVILATREKERILPGSNSITKIVEVVAARASSSPSPSGNSQAAPSSPTQSTGRVSNPSNARPVAFPKIDQDSNIRIVRGSPILSGLRPETRQKLQDAMATSEPMDMGALNARMDMARQEATRPRTDDVAIVKSPTAPVRELVELREELGRMRRDMESLPNVNVGSEVQEIKILLHDIMKGRYQQNDAKRYPEYLANIAIKMRACGVMESLLTEILDTVSGMPLPRAPDGSDLPGEKLKEFYLNTFIRLVFKNITVTGPLKPTNSSQYICCLVGPTGVGKTTTIAKMGAALRLEKNAKVAFASMDSFRIAGAEQLRTYSKILDIPFAEIGEAQDLSAFIARNHACDYIFIDTAGRVARDIPHMESLKCIQEIDAPVHFHLALASTMKQRDIDETVRAFRMLNLESILFTKLDESWNYGEILNTVTKSRIPLSYFAMGQRVPEDLEVATKERIVEKLFQL